MASKKGAVAALLILVAGGLTYAQMKKMTPGPEINNGHDGEDFGPPRQERAVLQEIAREAKITPQQQKQLEQLRERGDWREMREKVNDILTSEQLQVAREQMRERFQQRRAQRDARMRAALGPEEFKRYQEKRDERFRNRGGRGRGGGPGGGRAPQGGAGR